MPIEAPMEKAAIIKSKTLVLCIERRFTTEEATSILNQQLGRKFTSHGSGTTLNGDIK